MVCSRCKMAVKAELEKFGLHFLYLELGEVEIMEELDVPMKSKLNQSLLSVGFEIIDDKKGRLIEKIKNSIIELVHHNDENMRINLSNHIAQKLNYDYHYLSNLFSEAAGTTIEKYFITQKIEKAKELLIYDELSLTEISDRLGYSSQAYLSNQFKKITGLTPTVYKSLKEHTRQNIEEL